jgi:carboxymethylenebutenolidase
VTDDKQELAQYQQNDKSSDLSRREFVALSLAAGITAAAGMVAADLEVVETDVEVKTPDGICDAVFIHPKTATHPGVLLWPDAFGLRPTIRNMGKRLAAEGYSVLAPNNFYRTAKAPLFDLSSVTYHNHGNGQVMFQDKNDTAKQQQALAGLNAPGAAEKDAIAYIAFLDAQKQVDKTKKIGTHGYCIGGRMVVHTAAAVPGRVGAGGSFYPGLGNMVTDKPNSPHLLAPKIKARIYFALASDDDMDYPDVKNKLREAFAAAKVPTEIEVYPHARHGWCTPDMPPENGKSAYNKPDAERAWRKLLSLYKATLT